MCVGHLGLNRLQCCCQGRPVTSCTISWANVGCGLESWRSGDRTQAQARICRGTAHNCNGNVPYTRRVRVALLVS
jgi:hypothetical protein